LAAPMAILAAGTIDRWIDQRRDEFTRLPDVAVTLTACATLMAGAAGVGLWMYAPESVWSAAPLVVLPLAGLGLLIAWRRTPAARRRAVACAGAAAIIAWAAALEIEDRVRRDSSPLDLIATIRHDAGGRTPTIGVYGIYDPTLVYYLDAETDTVALDTAQGRRAFLDSPSRAYVLVDARTWSDLNADGRLTDEGFDVIDAFRRWFDRKTLVIAERHVDHP
ncbi:MAG: hypothetical protein KDA25_05825, partial [Phycisphaerales bacterium]|nr:hypothetical protein [Phycisphaerales bacterium]